MKKIFKKLKGFYGSIITSFLSLVFINEVKARSALPLYGIPPTPTPGEILSKLLPFIGGAFLIFVIGPVGLVYWYRKQGGRKRLPKVIAWTLAMLFVFGFVSLVIYLYFFSSSAFRLNLKL